MLSFTMVFSLLFGVMVAVWIQQDLLGDGLGKEQHTKWDEFEPTFSILGVLFAALLWLHDYLHMGDWKRPIDEGRQLNFIMD